MLFCCLNYRYCIGVADILGLGPTLFWSLVTIVGLTLAIVVLFATIFACIFLKRKYFKKEIILGPILHPGWPVSSSADHYIKQPEYDAWEIPRYIIEGCEKEAIGEGCFGEVYRGMLQTDYARTSRLWKQHHRPLSQKEQIPVAIKRLKSE